MIKELEIDILKLEIEKRNLTDEYNKNIKLIDERIKKARGKVNSVKLSKIRKYFSNADDPILKFSFRDTYITHIQFQQGNTTKILLMKWSYINGKPTILNFEICVLYSRKYDVEFVLDLPKFKSRIRSLLYDTPSTDEEKRIYKLNAVDGFTRVTQLPKYKMRDKINKIKEVLKDNIEVGNDGMTVLKKWITSLL